MAVFREDKLKAVDSLITAGKGREAAELLTKILQRKIPRSFAARFAWQCVRCDMPAKGLTLLSRFIRGSENVRSDGSPEEKTAYAACLMAIGASQEALELLCEIPSEAFPNAILYRAHVLVKHWDYKGAIPFYSSYISAPGVTDYEVAIGELNLAGCLVHERKHDVAAQILTNLSQLAEKKQWSRLQGNSAQLLAENAHAARDWKEAEKQLSRAEDILKGMDSLDHFFIEKWRCFTKLSKSGASLEARRSLTELRKSAIKRNHWETVRDCDRILAVETQDVEKLRFVYFGTPYQAFRDWMLKDFGEKPTLGEDYVWRLGGGAEPKTVFDIKQAGFSEGGAGIKAGSMAHRFLAAMSCDFYRPFRIAQLHWLINPDQYFSAESSAKNTYEGIRKFRRWIEANDLPLTVEEIDGQYRLVSSGSFGIRVSKEDCFENLASEKVRIDKLISQWPNKAFSLKEAMQLLNLSRRSVHRVLQTMVDDGLLTREGGIRTRTFRITQAAHSKKAA